MIYGHDTAILNAHDTASFLGIKHMSYGLYMATIRLLNGHDTAVPNGQWPRYGHNMVIFHE